jgi:hypothetical protein
MNLWNIQGLSTPDVAVQNPEDLANPLHGQEEEEDPVVPFLPEARYFILESKAYQQLLERIKLSLTLTPRQGTTIELIRKDIITGLSIQPRSQDGTQQVVSQLYNVSFEITWNPVSFLKEQYHNEGHQEISEVITLNGSAIDAQAITCAQYMHQVWPSTGNETLRVLQSAIAQRLSTAIGSEQPYEGNCYLGYIP